jgi:hypothetical protein
LTAEAECCTRGTSAEGQSGSDRATGEYDWGRRLVTVHITTDTITVDLGEDASTVRRTTTQSVRSMKAQQSADPGPALIEFNPGTVEERTDMSAEVTFAEAWAVAQALLHLAATADLPRSHSSSRLAQHERPNLSAVGLRPAV